MIPLLCAALLGAVVVWIMVGERDHALGLRLLWCAAAALALLPGLLA